MDQITLPLLINLATVLVAATAVIVTNRVETRGLRAEMMSKIDHLEQKISERREDFSRLEESIVDQLRAHSALLTNHEGRIGTFEGGRDTWLAMQKNNPNGS